LRAKNLGSPKAKTPTQIDRTRKLSSLAEKASQTLPPPERSEFAAQTDLLTPSPPPLTKQEEWVVETPKGRHTPPEYGTDEEEEEEEEGIVEEEEGVQHFGREHFGDVASPYLTAYLYNRRFLDKDYGIRKEEDGTFMLGNSPVSVDAQSNVIVHDKLYRGTAGLWELLTRKKVNQSLITTDDLRTYKKLLEMTSAHLENNEPRGNIKTTRGTKFKVIAKLFSQTRRRGVESSLRQT
jgi:hypothetical protein